jgi:hypothetical protein
MGIVKSIPLPQGGTVTVNYPPTLIADVDGAEVVYQKRGGAGGAGNVASLALTDEVTKGVDKGQVHAQVNDTIGGSPVSGDVLTLVFDYLPNGPVTVEHEVGGSETTATLVAAGLAAQINSTEALAGVLYANAVGAVVYITHLGGVLGNNVSVDVSMSAGAGTTQVISGAAFIGGVGPARCLRNFTIQAPPLNPNQGQGGMTRYFLANHYYDVSGPLGKALSNARAMMV